MLKKRKRKRRKPLEEKTQMIMMIEKEKFQNRRRGVRHKQNIGQKINTLAEDTIVRR